MRREAAGSPYVRASTTGSQKEAAADEFAELLAAS